MAGATTDAHSLADGPTLASTRDYWTLHLRSEGKKAPRDESAPLWVARTGQPLTDNEREGSSHLGS